MGQGTDPNVPEYTPATVQEPLRGPEGSLYEEPLLYRGSLSGKAPEPGPHCCLKVTDLLKRVTRTHLSAVIAVLILTVAVLAVSLAVLKANQCSDERGQIVGSAAEDQKAGEVLPPCDEDWIWYKHKCFNFSVGEGTWTVAKDSCAALNSSLAMIDTQQELDFMMRHKGKHDHWIGLQRVSEKQWRWINGTDFNNWFTVADYSDYAYLNHDRVKSGESYNTRNWICTKVPTYERKYKREKPGPSFL